MSCSSDEQNRCFRSFPTKDGSALALFTTAHPAPPALSFGGAAGAWGVLAGPRPAFLGQHCDRRDCLRMGPHSDSSCGHIAFITTEDSSAWGLPLCPGQHSIGHGGAEAAVRPVRGPGWVVRCIGGHFVWSALEGLAPCLGTRHRPPCDAPTGLSKVTNDEHWAVSGMW